MPELGSGAGSAVAFEAARTSEAPHHTRRGRTQEPHQPLVPRASAGHDGMEGSATRRRYRRIGGPRP